MTLDLLLIHPPSVYDFREKAVHYGLVSDLIPSTPIFELYPAGFLSLSTYLGKKGFKLKILNLAVQMLLNPGFNPEKALKKAEARVYGIDLHWLVHVQGALETAKLVKKLHPDSFLVVGGLTSTFFWRSLLENYSFIDAVVLGDTAEEALEGLLSHASTGKPRLNEIPNVAWRHQGKAKLNSFRPAPGNLDDYAIDYGFLVKEFLGSWSFPSALPFARFMREPIGLALTMKGCPYNCITCGGSAFAYKNFFNRNCPAFKSPEKIAWEILSLLDYMRVPVFVVGDVQLMGFSRVERLSKLLREAKVGSPLIYEFFSPPPRSTLECLRKTSDRVMLQISPESHEEEVRVKFGRNYGNRDLVGFIREAERLGFERLDLYFMVGLPEQTLKSAVEASRFFSKLLGEAVKGRGFLNAFTAPLAPFIDPGSMVYMKPEAFGYRLLFRDVESHVKIMEEAESWGEMLDYETAWMSRREIVAASYLAAEAFTKVKMEHGIISEEEGLKVLEAIKEAGETVYLGKRVREKLVARETVSKGDLYPGRRLIFSLKPKFYYTLLKALLKRI
ncbi:MAG: cobalamin B12-binding domain-containing protein [Candidatus Hecatellales archaeon B24]|nr:MAG: cobalamin B12-binding domain-containing protein [Candidatus Hecatellales archaeon B24]